MKVKANLIILFLITVIVALFSSLSMRTYAHTVDDVYDRLFYDTLTEVLDYEQAESTQIITEKEIFYDITLQPLGFLYQFTLNEKQGFAIIIDTGVPQVTEIVTDGAIPYQTDDMKIYVTLNTYWTHDGQNFYDCNSNLPVSEQAYATVSDFAFFGALELFYDSEQVDFQFRAENKYNILSSIPNYNYGLPNGCAAIAATNLIAYYDKTYTNLISNYDPGTTFLGTYRFKTANETTNALTETLHADMGTTDTGTTKTQFKNGVRAYANRQGYSIGYTSLVSFGKLNYENAKNAVQSNKAIAVFLAGFKTTTITNGDGYDTLNYEYAYSNHVAAAFGCLEVNYTFSNSQNRTDKYLHCAMGVGLYRKGYINISTSKIDDALVLNIS